VVKAVIQGRTITISNHLFSWQKLPLVASICVGLLTILFWFQLREQEKAFVKSQIDLVTESVELELSERINEKVFYLQNLVSIQNLFQDLYP
jgi:sensor domain CHASE-containing protein